MADLGIALTTVISSLNANQQALALISGNIANANTENYSRRQIVQTSTVVNGVSAGVQIEDVRRAVDEFAVTSARQQISHVGQYEIQSQYYDRLELYLGSPNSDSNISAKFDSFFARLAELANSPEQASLRTNTLESATSLTSSVSGLATNIQQLRFDIDQEIGDQVDDINGYLDDLANINLAIKQSDIAGGDKTALLDRRDKTLSDLSKIIDVNVSLSEDGRATIFLPQTELLGESTRFNLSYSPLPSVESLIGGGEFSAINVQLLNSSGQPTGGTILLASAPSDPVQVQNFSSGSLKGLLDMRDTELPNLLDQLNELTQTFADAFNAVHNDGAGFPPPSTLTGTRFIDPGEDHSFSGKARIALLNSDGTPLSDNFEGGGLPPLTLDFDALTSSGTPGEVDLDAIVREINEYYGPPPSQRASLGPLSDLRLAAVSDSIASTAATGNIVFSGNLGVGDTIQVGTQTYTMVAHGTPSNGANIELGTSLPTTLDNIVSWLNLSVLGDTENALYSTTNGNTLNIAYKDAGTSPNGAFTLDANLTPGATGSTANINGVGAAVNPAASALGLGTGTAGVNANGNFTFDFEMSNLTADDATFEVLDIDLGAGLTGQTLGPFTSSSGERQRTNLGGASGGQSITVTIPAGLEEGDTFNVTATIRVTDADGHVSNDTVTFTVTIPDPEDNIINKRYAATASGTADTLTAASNNSRFATARIVDADGNPVDAGEAGYLQIVSNRSGAGLVIDQLDSAEGGEIGVIGTTTNRGFSHFFGLNDFFTTTSDTAQGAAINFAVRDGYVDDPSRLATGELVRSNQPSDPDADPIFTYELGIGSNQLVTRLGELKTARENFDAAGGLPETTLSFGGYASEILSFAAVANKQVDASLEQEQTLYDAFKDKIDATGGINIDEELANTVLFQNNFNASARLITIISQMLDKMIESF